jgi:hypothetical protein
MLAQNAAGIRRRYQKEYTYQAGNNQVLAHQGRQHTQQGYEGECPDAHVFIGPFPFQANEHADGDRNGHFKRDRRSRKTDLKGRHWLFFKSLKFDASLWTSMFLRKLRVIPQ